MKIIRFFDEHDRPCYGHSYSDGNAILLEGELFGEFTDTGRRVRVKKILAPLKKSWRRWSRQPSSASPLITSNMPMKPGLKNRNIRSFFLKILHL
jgi:hypothetical protein